MGRVAERADWATCSCSARRRSGDRGRRHRPIGGHHPPRGGSAPDQRVSTMWMSSGSSSRSSGIGSAVGCESTTAIEADGRFRRGRGDIEVPGSACTRARLDLAHERGGDAEPAVTAVHEQRLQLIDARPDVAAKRGDPDQALPVEGAERNAAGRQERSPAGLEHAPPGDVPRRAMPLLRSSGDRTAMLLEDEDPVLRDVDRVDQPELVDGERPHLDHPPTMPRRRHDCRPRTARSHAASSRSNATGGAYAARARRSRPKAPRVSVPIWVTLRSACSTVARRNGSAISPVSRYVPREPCEQMRAPR